MLFASTAFAADPAAAPTGAAAGEPSVLTGLMPLLLVAVVLYFMIMRPQMKKVKDHETMTKALRRGDRIVTGGGVVGVIHKIEGDDMLVVEVAPEVRIKIMRDTISHVISKPAPGDNANDNQPK